MKMMFGLLVACWVGGNKGCWFWAAAADRGIWDSCHTNNDIKSVRFILGSPGSIAVWKDGLVRIENVGFYNGLQSTVVRL